MERGSNDGDCASGSREFDWVDVFGYCAMHFLCLGSIWTRVGWRDVALCAILFVTRVFGVGVGWHRYLAHRSFKTSRFMQFVLVMFGTLSWMKGGLWFAHQHAIHHRFSDTPRDRHAPGTHGLLHSHSLWFMQKRFRETDYRKLSHWTRFPELVWLNEYGRLPTAFFALGIWWFFGWSGLLFGFFFSTILVWHTFHLIGSACHSPGGYRRFATLDYSYNHPLIGVFSLGEGWHNNHHHLPNSARMGLRWWELDLGWCGLVILERMGLVWDLKRPLPEAQRPAAGPAARRMARLTAGLEAADLLDLFAGHPQELQLRAALSAFSASASHLLLLRPHQLVPRFAALRCEISRLLSDNTALAGRVDAVILQQVRSSRLGHLMLEHEPVGQPEAL